jgi:hypothetical protein
VKRILFFLLSIVAILSAKSQNYDDLQVSLLTIEPRSKAVYTIFGHTGLRLSDSKRNMDVVFNWGTFDNHKPNFIYHFVKGETIYFLSTLPMDYFNYVYSSDDATTVIEQSLDIPAAEKESLMKMLENNLLPENIEYRYDFFFDNCTTRPRDIIEKFCGGQMIYPPQTESITFRKLLHQYTKSHPWLELGIDCVIGSGADSLITYRSGLFLPAGLKNALDRSVVKYPDGTEHPMVISTRTLIQTPVADEDEADFPISPLGLGIFFLLVYVTFCISAFAKKRRFRILFALLFLLSGVGGCLVAFIGFISIHPCTWPNWNILWLHPLHLVGFVGFLFKKSYPVFRWYHAVNFVILSCFLLGWHWIPQRLNLAFIPFILCLWVVSGFQAASLKEK